MLLPNEFVVLSAAIILGVVGLCGIIAGWASSRLLRLSWSRRTWMVDAALAAGLYLVLALIFGTLTRGNRPNLGWLALAATLSVVLRHLGRRALGRAPARRAS